MCYYYLLLTTTTTTTTTTIIVIRSTPKSRPNNMGQMSVRPSVHKSFTDSDEILYVGRGRWVMHDGMPYDAIQGQGHETFKVRNSSILKIYLLRQF